MADSGQLMALLCKEQNDMCLRLSLWEGHTGIFHSSVEITLLANTWESKLKWTLTGD